MKKLNLEANQIGRDFVVGDLHGCYERLQQLLDHVSFDTTKDRLIAVGDLVDRGPENEKCLRLLNEPWFYSVFGNHEQLMTHYFNPSLGPYGTWWVPNGGMWGRSYGNRNDPDYSSDLGMEVRDLVKKAAELPVMITVEMTNGKCFHVIHAELSAISELTDEDLQDEEKFAEAAFSQTMDGDFIIWGRFLFYSLYNRQIDSNEISKYMRTATTHKFGQMFGPNLSHIYSGHTIMQKPVRYKGQTNLDTGSFISVRRPGGGTYGHEKIVPEWAGLTMTEPLTDRFWQAREPGLVSLSDTGVREIKPVIVE